MVVRDSKGLSTIVDFVVNDTCLLGVESCFDNLTCRLGYDCNRCPYNKMKIKCEDKTIKGN